MPILAMKIPFTGGCVCGEVRYECSAPPLMMFKCHCRDCQQVTGGPFVPAVNVPLNAFKIIQGTLQHYATLSIGGGHNLRGLLREVRPAARPAQKILERGFIGTSRRAWMTWSWFKPHHGYLRGRCATVGLDGSGPAEIPAIHAA